MQQSQLIAERFLLRHQVGHGAMGSVYYAQDRVTGRDVALKVSVHTLQASARLRHEAELLAELTNPSITRYVSHGEIDTAQVWLAMEWLDGETLERQRHDLESILTALDIVQQAAQVLVALHQIGVVHRDVSPANILLTGVRPTVHLIDFGVAMKHPWQIPVWEAGTLVGTPHYMPPEQALGSGELSPASDVYALAAILYELLSGRPPFEADSTMALLGRIVLEQPLRLRKIQPGIPHELDRLVTSALAKDYRDRPSAKEFAQILGAIHPRSVRPLPAAVRSELPNTMDEPILGERRMLVVFLAGLPDGLPIPAPMSEALASAAGPRAVSRRLADGTFLVAFGGTHTQGDEILTAARLALIARRMHPALRIALSTGLSDPHDEGFAGEPLDRGATALALASSGEIVIDAPSVSLLGDQFEVVLKKNRTVLQRELDEPRVVARVLGRRSPFLGRAKELGMAIGIYREALEEKSARAIWITGAPGIGKSRIREELLQELGHGLHAPSVLLCRGDRSVADIPFASVGRGIRRLLGLVDVRVGYERDRALEQLGSTLPPRLRSEIVPFLAELADVKVAESDETVLRAARQDPILMRQRISHAFAAWVQASASLRAFAFVFDDIQDADRDSLWLVDNLIRDLRNVPVCAILLGRPEAETRMPNTLLSSCTRIHLPELSRRAAEGIVRASLSDVDNVVIEKLVSRGGGNPLFLEELIRATAEGRSEAMPASIHALIQARLDRLPVEARRVLRAASVFGRSFLQTGLAYLVPDVQINRVLELLAHHEWISPRPSIEPTERRWIFVQPVLFEAIHMGLSAQEKKRLHLAAADWFSTISTPNHALVAHHLEEAGAGREAGFQYVDAAIRALGAGALDAAIHASSRALALDIDGEKKLSALLTRTEAELRLGRYSTAIEDGIEVSRIATPNTDMGSLGLAFAGYARCLEGEPEEGLVLLDRALQQLDPTELPVTAGRIRTALWRCRALADLGRTEDASDELALLKQRYASHSDPQVLYTLVNTRAYVASLCGDLALVLHVTREALALARQLGDSVRVAMALDLIVRTLLRAGDSAQATLFAKDGMRSASAAGAVALETSIRLAYAQAISNLGNIQEGVREAEGANATAEQLGVASLRVDALSTLALLYLKREGDGDIDLAMERAGQAVHLGAQSDITAEHAWLALGRCLIAKGNPGEAEVVLYRQTTRRHPWEIAQRIARYDALQLLEEKDEADRVLVETKAMLEQHAFNLRTVKLEHAFLQIPEHARILQEKERAAIPNYPRADSRSPVS